ncbi:MAG: mechanosensitive ion channel family protein [Oscillospiraceae bacterium]|nr:mechanosensitive ion channel family protein [Oscillospiraceae bacterium]
MLTKLIWLAESVASELSEAISDTESHEPTLGDAVTGIVDNPEETISALNEFFGNIGKAMLEMVPKIIFAAVILIIGLIITKLSLKLLSKGLSKSKMEVTVTKFTTQILKIIMYVLLITIVLSILGIPATSIITVIGTAGVAIGLALQDSLSNVAGGFLLMVSKPFKIGDYIISNGVEGTVSAISILHTRLNSASNQAVFIPNGQAINATIINNNGNDTRRVDLTFSISYNDDFSEAQRIIREIIDKHEKILHEIPATVRMKEHGDSAIIIVARPWCKTEDYWSVYFDLTEQVRAAFIEHEIEIPFNQLDVHMIEK